MCEDRKRLRCLKYECLKRKTRSSSRKRLSYTWKDLKSSNSKEEKEEEAQICLMASASPDPWYDDSNKKVDFNDTFYYSSLL